MTEKGPSQSDDVRDRSFNELVRAHNLVREALHIHQYGEDAVVTWAEWAKDAEAYLWGDS